MTIQCEKCGKVYDDVGRWTICPHGPIWAPHDAYCPKHDLVFCHICEMDTNEQSGEVQRD